MRNDDKTAPDKHWTIRCFRLALLLLLVSTVTIAFEFRTIHGLRKSEAALEAQLRDARVTNGELVLHATGQRVRLKEAEEDLALEVKSCDEDSVDLESGYLETVNFLERQLVSCNGENHKAHARITVCRWRLRLTEHDVITLRRKNDAEIYGEENLASDEWLNNDERMRLNEN